MTDAPYQRLLDTARTNLPGALDGGLQLVLFNVLREFLTRTNIWQDEIPLRLHQNKHEYLLAARSPSAIITRLMWLEGPKSQDGRDGFPIRARLKSDGSTTATLLVQGVVSENELAHAHVALTVTDPTGPTGLPRIPDDIVDGHFDTILSGLLERMMLQPSKPYSNPQLASYHGHRFRQGMSAARAELAHGGVFGGQAWRFPGGFRTRSQVF